MELWSGDEILSNHYATSVYSNGYLYGFHGRQEFNPSFRAVDLKTGVGEMECRCLSRGLSHVGRRPSADIEGNGRADHGRGDGGGLPPDCAGADSAETVRSLPALADGFLYARNNDTHKDELVCVDLR